MEKRHRGIEINCSFKYVLTLLKFIAFRTVEIFFTLSSFASKIPRLFIMRNFMFHINRIRYENISISFAFHFYTSHSFSSRILKGRIQRIYQFQH